MALRMTEEEFAEWQRGRAYAAKMKEYGGIAGAVPVENETLMGRQAAAKGGKVGWISHDRQPTQQEIEEAWERAVREGRVGCVTVGEEPPKKRSKYGNRRAEVDGIRFDSQHEASVYMELMARVRAGEIKAVMRQVKFDLGGGYHAEKGSRYQYIADFVTVDYENRIEVLDAKSEATRKNRVYINKKKQMLAEWGLDIREV